jgi:hypothetical protein
MDFSASHHSPPVLIDNALAQENLKDSQLIGRESNRKKRSSSHISRSDDQGKSKAKRQLFSGTEEEPSLLPSSPIGINSEVSNLVLSTKHQDDDDRDTFQNYCLVDATGAPHVQPLPFIAHAQPSGDVAGLSGDYSGPPLNTTHIFTPDVDSNEFDSFINGSLFVALLNFFNFW